MLTIALLTGLYQISCTQTQITDSVTGKPHSGFAVERYTFSDNHYKFERTWFNDSKCTTRDTDTSIDREEGTFTIGAQIKNFDQTVTAVDFTNSKGKTDLGAVQIVEGGIKIARGLGSNFRNTMVSIFVWKKK